MSMADRITTYPDLQAVEEEELIVLDHKRAVAEGVTEALNLPQYMPAGKIGALLVHGYTASPYEMLPLAKTLGAANISVYATRVAGHGSSPENLNSMKAEDQYQSLKYGYWTLRRTCDRVFVVGMSNGGLLSTLLARHNPVDGLVLLAPAITVKHPFFRLVPIARWFLKHTAKSKEDTAPEEYYYKVRPVRALYEMKRLQKAVWQEASRITVPVFAAVSEYDDLVKWRSVQDLLERFDSNDVKSTVLSDEPAIMHMLVEQTHPRLVELHETIRDWILQRS